MRILLVADVDPVRVIGGAERLLAGHAAALSGHGHEVVVCTGARGVGGRHAGIRVERIGCSPLTPGRVGGIVRRLRPDVVLGYQPACALGALRAARRLGIPTIYVFCSSWPAEYATRRPRPRRIGIGLRRAVEGACLGAADRVVVLSEHSALDVGTAHPHVRMSLRIVPGGVDVSRFAPNGSRGAARARLGLPAEGPLLITVRNLVPRMGLDTLIDAMPAVVRCFPRARLVVAGEGPLRVELEAQARVLGLRDRVLFPGFVPEEQLPDHYRSADLAVLPTRMLESFGLSTVEALACGTPVVGTPVGGTPEILHPLDIRLITEDTTSEALASRILDVLRSPSVDIARRARHHVIANYTCEQAAGRLEEVIREVVR